MSRQIEQALLSLMPTYGTDLPPQLVDLAGSLLAQSRHHASTLKADEEVARLYACANIACDRLKITLDLPPIEPRPPIPPRIYKRLYTHLNNILPSSAPATRSGPGRVRTPSSRLKSANSSPASGSRPLPSRGTPTKETSLSQFRTPSKAEPGTPSKSTGKKAALSSDNEFPVWIKPVARFLCQETNHKKLAPTVLAGMEAIIVPGGRKTEDKWVLQNCSALLAAIYFHVTTKAKNLASLQDLALASDIAMKINNLLSGETIDISEYEPERNEIAALLSRARQEVALSDFEERVAWDGWTDITMDAFDEAVSKVNEREWLKGDWYQGIADIVKLTQRGTFDDVEMLDDDTTSAQTQVKRADTMFQERYDYLSEAKRADYIAWKKSILAKIDSKATTIPMEVDIY